MSDPEQPDPTAADRKVKELLDASTRAELERWFGMPSFERLSDQGQAPAPPTRIDEETLAVRKRKADALAAVDPAIVEWHRRRTTPPDDLIKFKAVIDVRVDPDVTMFDYAMLERQHTVSEPIEREVSEDIRDDMRDRAPQALLRDLHRPETYYEKQFEVHDYAAEGRVDASALVAELIKTRWALHVPPRTPVQESQALLDGIRAQRRQPWAEIKMRNRRNQG